MLLFVLLLFGAFASAQEIPKSQPPLWSGKPDVAAFEKIEESRLAAAQQTIGRLVAVKGPRTIENTLRPYDDALQLLDSASYFAGLMQQVHPDAAFRAIRATAMVR